MQKERFIAISCRGHSMYPFLRTNDIVIIDTCPQKIHKFDIIAFKVSEKLFVHRVRFVAGNCLVCKGDWNLHFDPPVHTDEILGKCVLLVRNGRFYPLESRALSLINWLLLPLLDAINLIRHLLSGKRFYFVPDESYKA